MNTVSLTINLPVSGDPREIIAALQQAQTEYAARGDSVGAYAIYQTMALAEFGLAKMNHQTATRRNRMAVIDQGLPPMPTPTAEQRAEWDIWVAGRPPEVRAICERLPPFHYYDMPNTGQIATIAAYAEDGTVRVNIVGDRISIPAIAPLQVFGVSPDDLVKRP